MDSLGVLEQSLLGGRFLTDDRVNVAGLVGANFDASRLIFLDDSFDVGRDVPVWGWASLLAPEDLTELPTTSSGRE
jgi:hypothetical protein